MQFNYTVSFGTNIQNQEAKKNEKSHDFLKLQNKTKSPENFMKKPKTNL